MVFLVKLLCLAPSARSEVLTMSGLEYRGLTIARFVAISRINVYEKSPQSVQNRFISFIKFIHCAGLRFIRRQNCKLNPTATIPNFSMFRRLFPYLVAGATGTILNFVGSYFSEI